LEPNVFIFKAQEWLRRSVSSPLPPDLAAITHNRHCLWSLGLWRWWRQIFRHKNCTRQGVRSRWTLIFILSTYSWWN